MSTMKIFIFSTSRQFGVPSTWLSMTKPFVFMLTIGKTTEESRIFILMTLPLALTGSLLISFWTMKMDAPMLKSATSAMVGRSTSIILLTTRSSLVQTQKDARKEEIALIIIAQKKEEWSTLTLSTEFSNLLLETELSPTPSNAEVVMKSIPMHLLLTPTFSMLLSLARPTDIIIMMLIPQSITISLISSLQEPQLMPNQWLILEAQNLPYRNKRDSKTEELP